jgi:prophage antirepressor-like protein
MDITMIQDDEHEIWFKGRDLASILGYANTKKAIIDHVDTEDKQKMSGITGVTKWDPSNIQPHTVFINESGLYSLILRSKLAAAKQFKRWVTKDVLPSIRKTGSYTMKKAIDPLELRQIQIEETKMLEMISDSKLKQALTDRLMNEISGNAITNGEDQWSRDIVTLVKDERNKSINFSEAAKLGTHIVKKYKRKYNKSPKKYEKFVNGSVRKVNAYTKDEEPDIIGWLHEYYN